MSPADAEKWIVDLILDSKLVAKIDSRDNYVMMDSDRPSVYQQVLDRTERLTSSTFRYVRGIEGIGRGVPHSASAPNRTVDLTAGAGRHPALSLAGGSSRHFRD